MKHFLLLISTLLTLTTFAQKEGMTREEKDEKNAARTARINSKNDYAQFRKQIMALKQFEAERQKIPALRKSSGMPVKVTAVIDSNDNEIDGDSKTLLGYIRQDIGDNSTNVYEVTYDRGQKTIIGVKRTAEASDADREEIDEDAPDRKPGAKKVIRKKTKADDDDDADEEKPAKGKHPAKDKDED